MERQGPKKGDHSNREASLCMERLQTSGICLASFSVIKDLGIGGFGSVHLVRFIDSKLASSVGMPALLALKKIRLGSNVTPQ
jgi:hypothetical protein